MPTTSPPAPRPLPRTAPASCCRNRRWRRDPAPRFCPSAGAVKPSPAPAAQYLRIGLSSGFARPISAPVLPALTQACARPSFTSSSATRIELPRLLRIACAGRASLAITDCAGMICRRERCSKSALASNGVMASGSPTKRSVSCELEFSACSAAGTVTDGPNRPP